MVGTGRLALPRLRDSQFLGSADSLLTTCPKSAKVLKMRTLLGITVAIAIWFFVAQLRAAPPSADASTAEIVKAMNFQNQQLKRIADSLAIISGQQPGWKLPK